MRVVVTGGAGFLGSHLCRRLLADGHLVVCVDNLSTGAMDNVSDLIEAGRMLFVRADVSDGLAVDGAVDKIVHLASPASPVDYLAMPLETLKAGSHGTLHALELARMKGARLVLASTSEVYGDPLVHPQPESYWGNVNQLGPRAVYDEAKRFAETLTTQFRASLGLSTGIARIFNTFGPRMRIRDGRAVPTFITQALRGEPITVAGTGTQTRSICYVDDVVDGLVRLMHSDEAGPFNFGNPYEVSVLELANQIRDLVGSNSPIVHVALPVDDPRQRRPVIDKAGELLAWAPRADIEESLRSTIEWFRHRVAAPTPVSLATGVGADDEPSRPRLVTRDQNSARDASWIPLSNVDLTDVEGSLVSEALAAGWISGTGEFVNRFEAALGKKVRREHTIAVANGTLALELVLRGLGIGSGDEVIVPALTFAAPAMSVLAVGATPVFADVTPETWTLSPDEVKVRLTGRTRAIIAVDALGHPADYDALVEFGVPVIQDAAEAHGSSYKGQPAGSLGIAAVFSFHANKAITTGEGGAVCTDDVDLADRMRAIANHGMLPARPYVHEVIGRNFRMTNLTAAIGVGQVQRWDELVGARRRVSRRYDELLPAEVAQPRPVADWAQYACWLHTVTVNDRPAALERLRSGGVDARAIWPALPDQPLFAHVAVEPHEFSVSRKVAGSALWLPTYPRLTDEQITLVVGLLSSHRAGAGQ